MRPPVPPNPSRRAFLFRGAAPDSQPSVVLDATCFAFHGVQCESCRDTCEAGALRFMLQHGAMARPVFDPARCTRCGECASVCPANAIRVAPKAPAHG
jgi:ferredoxin-type protein NapF